jgi:hypothetical protein
VPTVTDLRTYPEPRHIGHTEQGDEIRRRIALIDELTAAFHSGVIPERG